MGLGRNFVPCMRTNGKVMMKIQVDPVVIDFIDLVEDTVAHIYNLEDALDFSNMSKKEVIKQLKSNAEYASYNGYGSKEPNILECSVGYYAYEKEDIKIYNICVGIIAAKLKLVFPQWKDEDNSQIEKLYREVE